MRFCDVMLVLCMLLLSPVGPLHAEEPAPAPVPSSGPSAAKPEISLELDAYYSNVGLNIPLTNTPIPEIGESDEFTVYRDMFFNALTPRFVLFEASVYPMPVLGSYLKKNHPDIYKSGSVVDDVNLIESVTAGFQEPYSFTVFFGDIVSFVKEGELRKETNKGYMGYMVSYATQHIKNNQLFDDHSWEIEWKLKGDRVFTDEKLSWSFRLGTKLHGNPDITDVAYLGLRRSSLDFKSEFLSWLKNSSFELRWDFSTRNASLLRQEYIIGKRYPLKDYHVALTLDFGLVWQSFLNYTGRLRDEDHHSYTLVFRPNFEF